MYTKAITYTLSNKKIIAVLVLTLSICLAFAGFSRPAEAQTFSANVHGWAWSDNVGWISLNCAEGGPTTANSSSNICGTGSGQSNYGVSLTAAGTTGTFSGHAWSDNLGWISFNSADVSSCGSAGSLSLTNGGYATGWAKALSADSGWDGCISLGGSNYGLQYTSTQTTTLGSNTLPGKKLSGWTWDSAVLGWIDFTYASADPATANNAISISATTPIIPGASTTITWTTIGVANGTNGSVANTCTGTETLPSGASATGWTTTNTTKSASNATSTSYNQVVTLTTLGTYTFTLHNCKDATTGSYIPDVSATVVVMNPTCAINAVTPINASTPAQAKSISEAALITGPTTRAFTIVWTPASPGGTTTMTASAPTGSNVNLSVSGTTVTVNAGSGFVSPMTSSVPITVSATNGTTSCSQGGFYLMPDDWCTLYPNDPACNPNGGGGTRRPPWIEF